MRSAEKIAAVAQSVLEHPSTTIRHRSQELNIPRTSLRKIFHKDLGMKAYKVQIVTTSDCLVRILEQWHHWAIFFEIEQGTAVTVNGERCRDMLNEFLFPKIEEDDMGDIWFQQDGTTCHTANVTINLLRTAFENRIIRRNSDVNWSRRSCDLTPLDYFL